MAGSRALDIRAAQPGHNPPSAGNAIRFCSRSATHIVRAIIPGIVAKSAQSDRRRVAHDNRHRFAGSSPRSSLPIYGCGVEFVIARNPDPNCRCGS